MLAWYSPADSAEHADECSKAALFRRERQVGLVYTVLRFVVLGFVCVNQRDLREILWFICADCLSTLACYSPADSADYADECSKAALFRRERHIGEVNVVLWVLSSVVLGFVCVNLRDQRENRPFKSVRRATSNKVKHRAT